jgi:hypothetical protein
MLCSETQANPHSSRNRSDKSGTDSDPTMTSLDFHALWIPWTSGLPRSPDQYFRLQLVMLATSMNYAISLFQQDCTVFTMATNAPARLSLRIWSGTRPREKSRQPPWSEIGRMPRAWCRAPAGSGRLIGKYQCSRNCRQDKTYQEPNTATLQSSHGKCHRESPE